MKHARRRARSSASWVAAAAGLALSLLLGADGARADGGLSLAEAVSLALARSYDARIARLEAERAWDAQEGARHVYYPKLWFTSNAGWSNRLGRKLEVLDHRGRPKTYGLNNIGSSDGWINLFVDQVLIDIRQWREAERTQLSAELADLQETARRESIAYEVTRLFTELLRVEQLRQLVGDREEKAAWLDAQAELLLEAGRALSSERESVALHLEGVRLDAELRRGEAREAGEILWLAVGGAETMVGGIELDPSLPRLEAVEAEALDEAAERAPELRALAIARRIEEKSVSAARAGRLPTLNLHWGYSHYGIKRFDNYDDEFLVGVDLRVPLFDGFETKNAVEGAQKSVEIARLRHDATLASKRARLRELSRRFESAEARLALTLRRAAAADEELRLADLNLRAQRSDLSRALGARESWTRARRATIDARSQRTLLWAELHHELGRLTDALGVGS
jgi:outer membrane protein TolC